MLLATFTFLIAFIAKRQSCGQEARALRGKSIGGKRNAFGNRPVLPQKEAGPWAIHRIAPTRIYPKDVIQALCPPGPRNEIRLMVFPHNALASWPGKAWNSISLTGTWRKVKVDKLHCSIDGLGNSI